MRKIEIPLEFEAEIATSVGVVIGQFQALEAMFALLLHFLTGIDQRAATILLLELPARRRRELLATFCSDRLSDAEVRDKIIKFLSTSAKSMEKRRNMYAHGTYGAGPKSGSLTLIDMKSSKSHTITGPSVRADVEDFAQRLHEFQNLVVAVAAART
jgi:hypothetical protein